MVAVVLFAAWQWFCPVGLVSVRGLNPDAVVAWRTWLGLSPVASLLPVGTYSVVFRTLLVVAWTAYAGLWWCVWCDGDCGLTSRRMWFLAIFLVVGLAVAQPANLSTDVYAYVGYGRMSAVHGLNPYLHTQAELVRLGDPTAPYLHWPIPSPYGPLWTMLSAAIVFVAPGGAVMGPVVALKLCAGAALLAAAAAARGVARSGGPRRGDGVFALVALNPLLLVEGPGNGHNDLVMVALLLTALVALSRNHVRLSAVLVGLSTAIKLVPLIVVPWLAILTARAEAGRVHPRRHHRIGFAAFVTLALAIAPVIAAYAPFWSGARTLAGVTERWRRGDSSQDVAGGQAHQSEDMAAAAADRVQTPATRRWPIDKAVARARHFVAASWPALLILVWASLAMALGRGDGVARLATVWCVAALGIMLFVAGLWFPWYLAWLWPVLVLRFSRVHITLAAFALPFSLLLMLAYAMPPG